MLSPTSESAAKWNTALQAPSPTTARTVDASARSATIRRTPGGTGGGVSVAEAVEHNDVGTLVAQGEHHVAADKAGAAGDQETLLCGHGRAASGTL